MNESHLSAAEAAYASGDWQRAAEAFIAAADGVPVEGSGHALHHAGNALMRLGRHEEAADAYRRAAADMTYQYLGAVQSNLGTALTALGRNEEALDAFDAALMDDAYAAPYKALQGRAGALYSLGRFDEATFAYRQAAWADGNPDPGKALNNLGLAFMELGRHSEAVEAFKAALGVEGYGAKGKATVNLALAYAAMGFHEGAVREFETARDALGYGLVGSTLAAYEQSLAYAHPEGTRPVSPPPEPLERETVEGWETGELPPVPAPTVDCVPLPDPDDEQTRRFFTISETEMRDEERAARKAERSEKNTPRTIAIRMAVIVAILAAVAIAVAALLLNGIGYPTQEQTVSSLLDAYGAGQPYTGYWVAVPPTDVKQEMRQLPARFASYRLEGVDRAATKSTALVVVTLDSGSELSYDVALVREGVGWKVMGIKNRWDSNQD